MKNNKNLSKNNEYMVYGINGAESICHSHRCRVTEVYIADNFNSDSINRDQLIDKFKEKVQTLNRKQFQNKFSTFRTQGIVVYFSYIVYSELDLENSKLKNNCFVILDSIKDP